jgi:hypothetical protein
MQIEGRELVYSGKASLELLQSPASEVRRAIEGPELEALQTKTEGFGVAHSAQLLGSVKDIVEAAEACASRSQELQRNKTQLATYEVRLRSDPRPAYRALVNTAREKVRSCPPKLGGNIGPFLDAYRSIAQLQDFLNCVSQTATGIISIRGEDGETEPSAQPLRIDIDDPSAIAKLGPLVLIDGPPGCGKTTLMKIMALRLVEDGADVSYVACHRIPADLRKPRLEGIVRTYGLRSASEKDARDQGARILILDGLDESRVDFDRLLQEERAAYGTIVLACRSSYKTRLRDEALTLSVTLFSGETRDAFFSRWFQHDLESANRAERLVRQYPDIDNHTRLPLVATLTAVLVGQGYEPRTRADIYNQRLELLLERWDRARGIRRASVNDIGPKQRFLRQLAFRLHATRRRSFSRDDFEAVYQKALGELGYKQITVSGLLSDLTVGSGILTEEETGTFTLGHLSFQEHLVGQYLAAANVSVTRIVGYLGDPWWKEPLLFYAAIHEDITSLVRYCMDDELAFANSIQLLELARVARYTSAGIIDALEHHLKSNRDHDSDQA